MSLKKIKQTDKKKKNDDLDPANDEFINKTSSFLDWAYERRRALGVLIAVVLVAAVAGIFASRYFEGEAAGESKLIASGLEAEIAPVVVPEKDDDDVPTPEPEDDMLTFDSVKARATEALKRWSEATSQTKDLKGLAELGKAGALLDLGEYDKAIDAYKAFLTSKSSGVEILKVQAVEGLGYALEAAGKDTEAKAEFEKLKQGSSGEIKKMVTYQLARLAEKSEDKDGAKKLYKEVLENYNETNKPNRFDVIFVQARTRLLTLDPKAEVPELPSGTGSGLDGLDPRLLQQLMAQQRSTGAS